MIQLLAHLQRSHIGLDHENRRVWRFGTGDQFSVKSCYGHMSNSKEVKGPWSAVWYNGVPFKVQFFMWTDDPREDFYYGYLMVKRLSSA